MTRTFCILLALSLSLAAQTAERFVSLKILPETISLEHDADHQRFLVIATRADRVSFDVTAECEISVSGAGHAEARDGVLFPKKDGKAQLRAQYQGLRARTTLSIRGCGSAPQPSFHRDVIPILTRQGCNSGGCHGSASGKNGFRLSLFGYDPKSDHLRLTRELRGRRLDRGDPARSLILDKPTMSVAHKGGRALDPESPEYHRLLEWVEGGAAMDEANPAVVSLEVFPKEAVLVKGGVQRFLARVRYADGSDRDVTRLARFDSTDTSVGAFVAAGQKSDNAETRLQAKGRGEATVMVRFGTLAEVARVLVVEPGTVAWPDLDEHNEIDRFVHEKQRKLRIPPTGICSDEVFVRRVYLDVLSVLPSVEETQRFLADARPDKRERLVDELLERPELADTWTMLWAEVLRVGDERLEEKGMETITRFLRKAFTKERPFDEIIAEILVAEGSGFESPGANFYLVSRDPKEVAENVAQVFLGVRIQCAQCHNHPFERWTMDDYYGFAAFFTQVGVKRDQDPRDRIIYDRKRGEARHPVGNAVVPPRYLGGEKAEIPAGEDRRYALARWLTSGDNPWFAHNVANRVWARFFGRGIVEPVDDVRTTNPASHPELLDFLAKKLVDSRFELRSIIRLICNSRSYQLASRDDETPAALFAGAAVRRLTAEQLLDAVGQVTGVPTAYPGLSTGARATEVVGGKGGEFLSIFGRPARSTSCACERRAEPTLSQALHLINGSTLESKIRSSSGRLSALLKAGTKDAELLDQLWLSAYSRKPLPAERKGVLDRIAAAKDRKTVYQDLLWAILNSPEFLFNH